MKLVVIFIFLVPVCLFAQSKPQERAELYFQKQQYALALEELENMSVLKFPDNLKMMKAVCFYHTKQYAEAYRLLHQQPKVPDSLLFIYQDVCKKNNKQQGLEELFMALYRDTSKSNGVWRRCLSIPKTEYEVLNLEALNTEYGEISPVRYRGGLVFSSNRENMLIERKSGALYMPTYDLYLAEGDSLYPRKVSKFSSAINSIHHECCATFTSDFSSVFYARTFDHAGQGGKNTVKLFSALYNGKSWEEKLVFRFNDTTHSYSQPALEAKGEIFFFASDREGGYGGSDIYVAFKEGEVWSEPVNLGPGINSEYNELYPYFHSDSTLYFSSNRPEGLGGYDIYKAVENEEGDYAVENNIGTPINTVFDEYSFFLTPFGYGYFSSNRPEGKGNEDLYIFRR